MGFIVILGIFLSTVLYSLDLDYVLLHTDLHRIMNIMVEVEVEVEQQVVAKQV